MTTSTKRDFPRKTKDRFSVGDLVITRCRKMIYMLVPKDNSYPLRTGSGTLTGVCVWTAGGKDRDGDDLPSLGYLHNNLGENHMKEYHGTIGLTNEQ